MSCNHGATVGGEAAASHAECAICFDDLCSQPVAVCIGEDGKRSCRHYYHLECMKGIVPIWTRGYGGEMEVASAEEARREGKKPLCPLCRVPFSSIAELPDPFKDLRRWFRIADVSGTGALSRDEVRDVLRATVPCDETLLDEAIERRWREWDKAGTGSIREREVGLLLAFIRDRSKAGGARRSRRGEPPFIAVDREGWFEYWDEDSSGALSKEEVARALIKTFDAANRHVDGMQRLITEVWPVFDVNRSGTITRGEFLRPDGLADVIIATLNSNPRYAEAAARQAAAQSPTSSPRAPPAARRSSLAMEPPKWSCLQCTFLNLEGLTECAVCGVPKGSRFRANTLMANTGPGPPPVGYPPPVGTPPRGGYGSPSTPPRAAVVLSPYANSSPPPAAPPVAAKVCVVCAKVNQPGKQRSSGWKCTGCIGKPSRWGS